MTNKARILIVEDESIIALDIRDRLELGGSPAWAWKPVSVKMTISPGD
jgi:hypothetical protein